MTEVEYLRMEESAQEKHEFRGGLVVCMSGGSIPHARIAANLLRHLGNRLEGKPCQPYGSDLRIRVSESGNFYYPDISIVCEPFAYAPGRTDTVVNPIALIEVTSPSSKAFDRGEKFSDYRMLASLQEHFLISQEQRQIETFYRQENGVWANL